MIDELVEEYSTEMTLRLREELTEQLKSILVEFNDADNEGKEDGDGTEDPSPA